MKPRRCQRILSRLKALEDMVRCEYERGESSAELMEALREYEEELERLRSMPGYTVDWEVQIAKKMVQDMMKEGRIDGAGADGSFE